MTRSTVLWIPHTAWSVPQRAKLYTPQLVNAGYEIHVTDADARFSSPRDFASTRYLRNFFPGKRVVQGIHIHRVPRISPALYSSMLRRFNSRIYERAVANIIREARVSTAIGTYIAPPPRVDRLIFDAYDDNVAFWKAYGRNPAYADEIAAAEDAYLERADVVIAASDVIRDRIAARTRRNIPIHVIPNGVDLSRFQPRSGQELRERLGLTSPVLGVVGNHDQPDELRRVIDVAVTVDPTLSLLIVGGGASLPAGLAYARERGLQRVHATGAVPHGQVPDYLATIDIGLCPYRKTPADDARSPMRLVEYLAMEKRVVSTNLESIRRWQLPNITLVTDDVAGFAAGIRAALAQPFQPMAGKLAAFDLAVLTSRLIGIIEQTGEDEMPAAVSERS